MFRHIARRMKFKFILDTGTRPECQSNAKFFGTPMRGMQGDDPESPGSLRRIIDYVLYNYCIAGSLGICLNLNRHIQKEDKLCCHHGIESDKMADSGTAASALLLACTGIVVIAHMDNNMMEWI